MTTLPTDRDAVSSRWAWLWLPSRKRYLLFLPIGALVMFALGIVFWGGFNTALEATNTEAFCISCHEMKDNVYQEYTQTIHYRNPAGVRATCPDCHVPRPWLYKIRRKIQASNELLHSFLGTIDTREKFLSHRREMAERVWDTMRSSDSRECRNCHRSDFMAIEKQDRLAQRKHASMSEEGKTCIDCHKGIAHRLTSTDPVPAAQADAPVIPATDALGQAPADSASTGGSASLPSSR